MCAYCFRVKGAPFPHPELECRRKTTDEGWGGGGGGGGVILATVGNACFICRVPDVVLHVRDGGDQRAGLGQVFPRAAGAHLGLLPAPSA